MIRDPIDIKNSNVWEKALKANEGLLSLEKRTVIVIGDQKAGKTSFIKLVKGDFDLQSKPTRLIDFYTMKKQGVQIQFYEISSPKFQSIMEYFIKAQNCAHTTILLCVDLMNTLNLVSRVSQKTQNIRQDLKRLVQQKNMHQLKTYTQERSKCYRYIEKNQDIDIIRRMPFKFVIVGCKYDLFEKMKVQEKKWVCRCLRYLAHVNEANLLFSSTKNMQIAAQLRNVFGQQMLGIRNSAYTNQKDHNKPLFILTGQDRVSQMSLPAFNNSGAFNEMKILQQQLESVFPSRKHIDIKDQIKAKQFKSIGLDSLISKHRKQISKMTRDKKIPSSSSNNLNDTQKSTNRFAESNMQPSLLKTLTKKDQSQDRKSNINQEATQKPKAASKNKNKIEQQQYMDGEQQQQPDDDNDDNFQMQ